MVGSGAVRGRGAAALIHVTGGGFNLVSRLGTRLEIVPISWAGGCILFRRVIYLGEISFFKCGTGYFAG